MGNCCKVISNGGKSGEYTLPPQVDDDDKPIIKNPARASVRLSKIIIDPNPIENPVETTPLEIKETKRASSSSSSEVGYSQ